jgi:hypothetical protein
LTSGAIHATNSEIISSLGKLVPSGGEFLAMSAPRSIKFQHPTLIGSFDSFVEIFSSKGNHRGSGGGSQHGEEEDDTEHGD